MEIIAGHVQLKNFDAAKTAVYRSKDITIFELRERGFYLSFTSLSDWDEFRKAVIAAENPKEID